MLLLLKTIVIIINSRMILIKTTQFYLDYQLQIPMKIYPLVDIEEGIGYFRGNSVLNLNNRLLKRLNVNGTISVECPEGSKRNPQHMADQVIHETKFGAINYLIVPDHPRNWKFNTSWPPPTTYIKSSKLARIFCCFDFMYTISCLCRWKYTQVKSITKVKLYYSVYCSGLKVQARVLFMYSVKLFYPFIMEEPESETN